MNKKLEIKTKRITYKCLTKVVRSIDSTLGVYFAVNGSTPTASSAKILLK